MFFPDWYYNKSKFWKIVLFVFALIAGVATLIWYISFRQNDEESFAMMDVETTEKISKQNEKEFYNVKEKDLEIEKALENENKKLEYIQNKKFERMVENERGIDEIDNAKSVSELIDISNKRRNKR